MASSVVKAAIVATPELRQLLADSETGKATITKQGDHLLLSIDGKTYKCEATEEPLGYKDVLDEESKQVYAKVPPDTKLFKLLPGGPDTASTATPAMEETATPPPPATAAAPDDVAMEDTAAPAPAQPTDDDNEADLICHPRTGAVARGLSSGGRV